MMTEKVLINAGYKEAPVPVVEQYANRFFQKKVKDDKGIKYFIDVYETNPMRCTGLWLCETEMECIMTTFHYTFQIIIILHRML